MLSIGNQPSDPPCASDTPHLHCSNSTHDRPSPSPSAPIHKLASPDQLDLTTSKPNFSIRNYVFTARSKDISSNWPFSSQNLQLCLKHGVKDPLPPFEASPGCTVEALDKKHLIIINPCTEEVPLKAKSIAHLSNNELTGKEKRINVHQNETQSVPSRKQSKPVSVAVPDSRQLDSGPRLLGKKSKVILKLGGSSDRTSTEDIASNSTVVSEAMASKVCPVCKTFSSSSNTTLNAHIDQCLSEDSTPKWTASTKLGRNRVKPRRTRLMVDIYVTAKHCTVEELELRNGRIWAGAASFSYPDQDSDPEPSEEKRHETSALDDIDEGGGGIGAVYIDSSGKKVRILSKSVDDQPRRVEGLGPRKSLKCAKKSKLLALKKKIKRRKADKFLKLASQTQKTRVTKDFGGQEIHHGPRGGSKYLRTCNSRPQGLMVHKESGTLKRWVCSKRSGLFKKVSDDRDCRSQNCDAVEAESERFNKQKTFSSFEHQEDTMRMKDSISDVQKTGMKKNQSPGKRKVSSSLTGIPPSKKTHVLDSFKTPWNSSRTVKASRFYRLNKESLVSAKSDSKIRMVAEINEEGLDISGDRPSTSDGIGQESCERTTFMRFDQADESSDDTSDLSGKQDDVESTGTEFRDDSYTEESFGMATERTSPNFSSYLNQENLKQLYKPPSPNFTTFADGEDSFSEDLGDDMDVNKEGVEDREYEVEGIPIPGPPGSFLPSPRALGSEDFHGTSSLTTSRVQSSQERVDNDSSDSPVSATSTISNPGPTAASTVKCLDPLDVTEVVHHKSSGPNSELELSGPKAVPIHQPIPSVSSEKGGTGTGTGTFRGGNGKSSWATRRDNEPCCCQRKERNNLGVVLNYQDSQLLRRRNVSLPTTIGTGKWVPDHLENNASRSSTTPPTPTNPVLRLMGKNLVLNKEGESLAPPGFPVSETFLTSRVFDVSSSSGGRSAPRAETSAPFYWRSPDNFADVQGNSQFLRGQNRHSRNTAVPNSKEIIIIDDSTDTEPDSTPDLARQLGGRGRGLRDRRPVVAAAPGFSFPTAIGYDPRVVTHFPVSYKVHEPTFFGQIPVDQSRRVGSGPMNARWCSAPGVSNLQQMPPPPATLAPMRSPLPYPPRLL